MTTTGRRLLSIVGDLEVSKAEIVTTIRELLKIDVWPERAESASGHRMIADVCDRAAKRLEGDAGSLRELARNHRSAAEGAGEP